MKGTVAKITSAEKDLRIPDAPLLRQSCDRVGIFASGLCIVHCLATPLLLLLLPSLVATWLQSPRFHQVMGVGVLGVAVPAFVSGYLRHRRAWIPLLAAGGLGAVLFVAYGDAAAPCCLICSRCEAGLSWSDWLYGSRNTITSLIGCSLLVTAHLSNYRCCRRCAAAGDVERCTHAPHSE